MMNKITDKIKEFPDLYSKAGVSKVVIDQAQIELHVKFSDDYLEVLTNFGILSVNGHEIVGLGGSERLNVVDVTKEERAIDASINMNWYVIEQASIDHIIIWQNQTGEVYQTQPGFGFRKIADNLLDYLEV